MRRRGAGAGEGAGDDGELIAPTPATATVPEVALVASAARSLPAEHPATPLLLVQTAVLNIGRGDAKAAIEPLARLDELAAARTPDPGGARARRARERARRGGRSDDKAGRAARQGARRAGAQDQPAGAAGALRAAGRAAGGGGTGGRRGGDAGTAAARRRRHRTLHRVQADGNARARRSAWAAARGGARGAGPAQPRPGREGSGIDGGDGHRAADVARVADLRRNAGGPGVARSAARAAGTRGGVRADGAGDGHVPIGDGHLPVAVRERHRPESAAAESGARVGLRRACRRSRGVHAHLPPARGARGPHRRQEGGGQEGRGQEDRGQEDGGQGDKSDGGQEDRQGRQRRTSPTRWSEGRATPASSHPPRATAPGRSGARRAR